MDSCRAVFFWQKPFTAKTEQLGCYYFNILSAVLQAKDYRCRIVPPLLPLCPRDNAKVEANPHLPWDSAILEIGSVPSEEVLDYSQVATLSLEQFFAESGGRVRMPFEAFETRGYRFTQDYESEYWVIAMPGRWDTQRNDPHKFFNELYPLLPLKKDPLLLSPEWFDIEKKKAFLGVHWRRGDRGNYSLGPIGLALWRASEPAEVAEFINEYLKKNPELEWVYVSTNSGSEKDRALLQQLVKKPLRYFERPNNIPALKLYEWDLCDLLQCAQAKHLLLSPGGFVRSSAFSRLILAECYENNPTEALVSFMPSV
jgi:hypothetical protein